MTAETEPLTQEQPTPTRLPYDVEFVRQTEAFVEKALQELPELQGLAIIPVWTRQPEKFPPGFLKLRAQNNLYVAELLKLLSLFTAFSVEVHKDFMGQVQILDNYLREVQSKLQETQQAPETTGDDADAQ